MTKPSRTRRTNVALARVGAGTAFATHGGMRAPGTCVALAVLTLLPCAATAQTWMTVSFNAIRPSDRELVAVRTRYAEALNAADPERLSSFYAPDAIAILGDGMVVRGRDQIRRYFEEAFSAGERGSVTLNPQQFTAEDRVASETGSFSEAGGGETSHAANGIYVTVYTRTETGDWHIGMELRTRGRQKQIVRW